MTHDNERPGSDPGADDRPVLVATDGGARTLTLNRPAAYNSFDGAMKDALLTAVIEAAADDTVRVLVIGTETGGRQKSRARPLPHRTRLVAQRRFGQTRERGQVVDGHCGHLAHLLLTASGSYVACLAASP